MCKKFFEEDPDATEDDVESELGVIRLEFELQCWSHSFKDSL